MNKHKSVMVAKPKFGESQKSVLALMSAFHLHLIPTCVGEPILRLDGLAISIETKASGCVNSYVCDKMVCNMQLPESLHPSVIHSVTKQHEHRASWLRTDTAAVIDAMIIQEGEVELEEAIEQCMIGAPPEFLISEIGDTLFLTIRRLTQFPNDPLSDRAEAAISRALGLCDELGINPNHTVLMKLLRNDLKYPHSISNNGFNQQEGIALSKAIYSAMTGGQGDYTFYAVWEAYGEQYCHDIPEPKPSMAIVPYAPPITSVVVYQAPIVNFPK